GQSVTAAEAERQGLVFRVVPRAELLPTALAIANELALKPAVALAAAKYAMNAALDPGITAGLQYELALWSHLFGTPDQKEGMRAFLEKRAAHFVGRDDWESVSKGFPWQARDRRAERP